MTLVLNRVPTGLFINDVNLMRKLFASLYKDITQFVIVRCRLMKILKKLVDLEFLTHKEHKTETKNSLSEVFYIKGHLSKTSWKKGPEIWSKSLKNIFKGVGLYFYSRINFCTTVSSCFSTVTEHQVFRTPSCDWFSFCCFW